MIEGLFNDSRMTDWEFNMRLALWLIDTKRRPESIIHTGTRVTPQELCDWLDYERYTSPHQTEDEWKRFKEMKEDIVEADTGGGYYEFGNISLFNRRHQ